MNKRERKEQELDDVGRELKRAKKWVTKLEKRQKNLEHSVYGFVGVFDKLPRELIFLILDCLFLGDLKTSFGGFRKPPPERSSFRASGPVSVFRFFITCQSALQLREEWCRHAYTKLGGLEDLSSAYAWMRDSIPKIHIVNPLYMGIVVKPKTSTWYPRTYHMTKMAFQVLENLQNFNFEKMPRTMAYIIDLACVVPESAVKTFLACKIVHKIERSVWMRMVDSFVPSMDFSKAIDILSNPNDVHDTLMHICSRDRGKWLHAYSDCLMLIDSSWYHHEPVRLMKILLRAYQPGWFQCWDDIETQSRSFNASTRLENVRKVIPVFVKHAPSELLHLPKTLGGEDVGRFQLLLHNIDLVMSSDVLCRVKLTGSYCPREQENVRVYKDIKARGGSIHLNNLLECAMCANFALECLDLVVIGAPLV